MATAGGRRRGMFQGPWSFNALELVRWLRAIPVGGLNELKYPPLSGPSDRAKSWFGVAEFLSPPSAAFKFFHGWTRLALSP